MNKLQIDLLERHNTLDQGGLFDAYQKPSQAKIRVWKEIVNDAVKYPSASRVKVNTYNTFMFTSSFTYVKDGKKRLRYYTPSETHDFAIT